MRTKLCGWAGCNHITTNKYYCNKHQAIADKRNAERLANTKPFQNAKRFSNYQDPEWRKTSAELIKEKGSCERCGSNRERLQVHHIIPIRYAPELFLDRSNMIVLCPSCHRAETQREINNRRR